MKIRLVEGSFQARTISGRTATVTDPNTVLTVCSDGSFQTTQSSQSILNFDPEFAAVPGPELAAALAAAAVGAVIIGRDEEQRPVTPH